MLIKNTSPDLFFTLKIILTEFGNRIFVIGLDPGLSGLLTGATRLSEGFLVRRALGKKVQKPPARTQPLQYLERQLL